MLCLQVQSVVHPVRQVGISPSEQEVIPGVLMIPCRRVVYVFPFQGGDTEAGVDADEVRCWRRRRAGGSVWMKARRAD